MKDLDITDISLKLIEATEEWEEKMKEYTKVEIEYQNTCDKLMSGESVSGFATQALREAHMRQIMQNDNLELFTKYNVLALETRMLRNRMNMYTTISANLRAIGFNRD